MKIFYSCYGSAHSSVVSAAIHTGMLDKDNVPTYQEIINLPHYDKTENAEIGIPFFYGYDEMDNEIYIIGLGPDKETAKNSIESFLDSCGVSKNDYVFINTLSNVNWWTRIGGFFSRAIGLVAFGRPLTVFGIKKTYFDFVKLVVKARRDIEHFQN